MVDPNLIRDLIMAADLRAHDVVLEIGAGLGTLTRYLARCSRKVIAIEVDRRLVRVLRDVLREYDNVEVIEGDALDIKWPSVDKVISNIPYSISSPITEKLLSEGKFHTAVLTYQLEFARRLCAKPGSDDYGRITILAYYYAEVELLRVVPRESFIPRPEVLSAIVRMVPKRIRLQVADEELFFRVVRELFTQRGRTLRKALKVVGRRLGVEECVMTRIGEVIDLRTRVEHLRPEDFAVIANIIAEQELHS